MKRITTILLLTFSIFSFAQVDDYTLRNLVKLAEIYSYNVNATGKEFKKEVNKLRTPELNHIIDALIAVGNSDKKLLSKKFLYKPTEKELKYWYVLRKIHYNNLSDDVNKKSNEEVAIETLEKEIDSRWLVNNYYYRIRTGIGKIFNKMDMSKYDFNLNDYGLKDDTEKAILYFNLTNALAQRFLVLERGERYEKLFEYAAKLPTFNGKQYYEYTSFDFEDFDWIGHEKVESYKKRHIGTIYLILKSHLNAFANTEKVDEMRYLFFNSIFSVPNCFKYSGGMEQELKEIYQNSQ